MVKNYLKIVRICTTFLFVLFFNIIIVSAYMPSYGIDNVPYYLQPVGGGAGYDTDGGYSLTGGPHIWHAGMAGITCTATTYSGLSSCLASATSGSVVFIPGGTTIDFTNLNNIPVPAGVTVASDRGYAGSNGANLIKMSTSGGWDSADGIFSTNGRFARITGFNFTGPQTSKSYDASCSAYPHGVMAFHYGAEIDNNEIAGFGGGGILVEGTAYTYTPHDSGSSLTYIHNNYIHDNHCYGYGYGVAMGYNSTVVAHANSFNANRHHIATDNYIGDSYEAAWNYVGVTGTSDGPEAFDSHATQISDRSSPYYNQYIGAKQIIIHHNTMDYANSSIQERGITINGTWVIYNRFNA